MVKKLGQWLPHALSDDKRLRRLDICTQLLSRSRRFDWLDTIVTGDEKWVLYVNHTHKRAWCDGDEMLDHPKFDNVRLLHDNGHPHIAKKTSRKFWSSDGKFYLTHRTARTWPQATTPYSDRFSITWKKRATMIVTTSKMTFGLSSSPSRRSSTPKESVIL
ncbi:hypothetical protein RB195_005593 [Necator americanus]|uniref:Transposase n=1 Tax=Necator americanus TaxID=51031 RepID=A0ABR1BNM5_NECAM